MTSRPHEHAHPNCHAKPSLASATLADDIQRLRAFLSAHFGEVSDPELTEKPGKEDELLMIEVTVDDLVARIDLVTMVSLLRRAE